MPPLLTDDQAVARLQREFQRVVRAAKRMRRLVFLELFAGAAGVSQQLRAKGFAVMSFDTKAGPEYDVLRKAVEKLTLGWMSSGCVAGIWLGTPCTSWSRARHGLPGTSWQPLRSPEALDGLPHLEGIDFAKIQHGNITFRFSLRIIRAAALRGISVALENPHSSFMWSHPALQKELRRQSCSEYVFDFCQYKMPWRKRTKVAAWSCTFAGLDQRCRGRKGVCSASNKHHIILQGSDPITKQLWTTVAEPYPRTVCRIVADGLTEALLNRLDHQRYRVAVQNS